jgi:hypothetical protein
LCGLLYGALKATEIACISHISNVADLTSDACLRTGYHLLTALSPFWGQKNSYKVFEIV